jgi:hypothetical protein
MTGGRRKKPKKRTAHLTRYDCNLCGLGGR